MCGVKVPKREFYLMVRNSRACLRQWEAILEEQGVGGRSPVKPDERDRAIWEVGKAHLQCCCVAKPLKGWALCRPVFGELNVKFKRELPVLLFEGFRGREKRQRMWTLTKLGGKCMCIRFSSFSVLVGLKFFKVKSWGEEKTFFINYKNHNF